MCLEIKLFIPPWSAAPDPSHVQFRKIRYTCRVSFVVGCVLKRGGEIRDSGNISSLSRNASCWRKCSWEKGIGFYKFLSTRVPEDNSFFRSRSLIRRRKVSGISSLCECVLSKIKVFVKADNFPAAWQRSRLSVSWIDVLCV